MAEFAVSRDGAVAVITIDNQSIGNALSRAGATSMADELDDIAGDVAVRAVLFRADGKQFCTGAHIGTTSSSDSKPVNGHMVRSLAASFHRLVRTIFECRVPVVTAVQGAALGAGLHLAVAADFVVAGELARFPGTVHRPRLQRRHGRFVAAAAPDRDHPRQAVALHG